MFVDVASNTAARMPGPVFQKISPEVSGELRKIRSHHQTEIRRRWAARFPDSDQVFGELIAALRGLEQAFA
jgi:hypothetical protein